MEVRRRDWLVYIYVYAKLLVVLGRAGVSN